MALHGTENLESSCRVEASVATFPIVAIVELHLVRVLVGSQLKVKMCFICGRIPSTPSHEYPQGRITADGFLHDMGAANPKRV